MNNLSELYFTMETYLFPMLDEEIVETTVKMKEFLRIVEMIKPSPVFTVVKWGASRWCGLGRPMKDLEEMLGHFS